MAHAWLGAWCCSLFYEDPCEKPPRFLQKWQLTNGGCKVTNQRLRGTYPLVTIVDNKCPHRSFFRSNKFKFLAYLFVEKMSRKVGSVWLIKEYKDDNKKKETN